MPGIDSRPSLILLASPPTKPVIASRPAPRRGRQYPGDGAENRWPQGGHQRAAQEARNAQRDGLDRGRIHTLHGDADAQV
jgi:hypothetical protein